MEYSNQSNAYDLKKKRLGLKDKTITIIVVKVYDLSFTLYYDINSSKFSDKRLLATLILEGR